MTSGTPLTRHCHWRFKLPASVNGGTHVKNKPPLQFVINETPFSKLFIKEPLHSKFADEGQRKRHVNFDTYIIGAGRMDDFISTIE